MAHSSSPGFAGFGFGLGFASQFRKRWIRPSFAGSGVTGLGFVPTTGIATGCAGAGLAGRGWAATGAGTGAGAYPISVGT